MGFLLRAKDNTFMRDLSDLRSEAVSRHRAYTEESSEEGKVHLSFSTEGMMRGRCDGRETGHPVTLWPIEHHRALVGSRVVVPHPSREGGCAAP